MHLTYLTNVQLIYLIILSPNTLYTDMRSHPQLTYHRGGGVAHASHLKRNLQNNISFIDLHYYLWEDNFI